MYVPLYTLAAEDLGGLMSGSWPVVKSRLSRKIVGTVPIKIRNL